MVFTATQGNVPFFGVATTAPGFFVRTQSSLLVVSQLSAVVLSCIQSVPLSSDPLSSNKVIKQIFSQRKSFIRPSMTVKRAASNYAFNSDAFVFVNLKSQTFPSSTQPSSFGFNYQSRMSHKVLVSSQFLDVSFCNNEMQNAGPLSINNFTPFPCDVAVFYTAPQSMSTHSVGFQQPVQIPVYAHVQTFPTDSTHPSPP